MTKLYGILIVVLILCLWYALITEETNRPVVSKPTVWNTETVPYYEHKVELYADSSQYELFYSMDTLSIRYEWTEFEIGERGIK